MVFLRTVGANFFRGKKCVRDYIYAVPNSLVRCSPFLFPLIKCSADSVVGTRVVNNCTIFLCSLDVGIVDDQRRGRSTAV